MQTENSIIIQGTREDVLAWVERIDLWPQFFPHYRWVKIHEGGATSKTATMAAKHAGCPLRWTSVLTVVGRSSPQPLATFRHIRGITRGMEVEWLVEPQEGGYCLVRIVHTLQWPRGARWIAQHVIGDFFVKGVASKTLKMVKHYVESGITPQG